MKLTHASAITLAIASLVGYATQVQGQSKASASSSPASTQVHFAQLKPPTKAPARRSRRASRVQFVLPKLLDKGAPIGRRRGAAGRGNCLAVNPPLTALVPAAGTLPVSNVWGLTVTKHPTFWFYVPYSDTSASSGEFVLQDEADNDVYRALITLPERPGVVSLRLPSTSAPLELGKLYHWYFKVNCDQQATSGPVFVEGWVQRVTPSPTLESQLAAATPQQQVALYAANGIWHEALTSLAKLRQVNPEDTALTTDWAELLQSAGLGELASAPMVQCCTPKNLEAAGASQVQKNFQEMAQ